MNCKFCGEPLEEGVNYCMNCGMTQENEEPKPAEKKNTGLKIAVIVLAVLVVAAAALLVYKFALPRAEEPAEEPVAEETLTGDEIPYDEATMPSVPDGTPSYTVTEEELTEEVMDKIIATCGESV
ncbi:MAG: hypothetical protein IIV87_00400, partial [Oscillospiraceae bacterium]|nr:hypothetical protein [Oscillospiraceae bacterium]